MSSQEPNKSKPDIAGAVWGILGVIGTVIVLAVIYLGWVNSGSNDGNFFGLAFQMPFESTEHYCWRKSDRVFTKDESAYQQCLNDSKVNSKKHEKIITYINEIFKDETGDKTVITSSQAECMANKLEEKLTDEQIEKLIGGGNISDQISSSTATEVLNGITNCAK